MKINLQLHVEEFEFIKVAIQQKTKSLIDYMDGSRKIAVGIERMNEEYLQEQASSIAEEEFEKELEGKIEIKYVDNMDDVLGLALTKNPLTAAATKAAKSAKDKPSKAGKEKKPASKKKAPVEKKKPKTKKK